MTTRGVRVGKGLWVAVVVPGILAAGAPRSLPERNRAVLDFARSSIGKQVGQGECTALVIAALRHAGARRPVFNGDPNADYQWGQLVATLTPDDHPADAILPGDLVQFRDVRIVTVRNTGHAIRTRTLLFPHHTAIVSAVTGTVVKVLHQNFGKGDRQRVVASETLRLNDLQAGTLWVYRPVAE